MDIDRLNQWLNLTASVGVMIGLIFLVIEINQSNRIASYSAEHSRRNQFIELNTVRIENSEVHAKLQAGQTDLSASEQTQALMMARQMINTWKDAEAAYDHGLLSDETFDTALKDISVTMEEVPGLIPYFGYLVDAYKLEEESSLISQHVAEGVNKFKKSSD